MTTPLDPTLAKTQSPRGKLFCLPHELLVHGVLPHLAPDPKNLRQLARVSRIAREKCQATAAYILRSNVHDVLEGTEQAARGEQRDSSVRVPRFSAAQVRGAHVYLDGLAGRAQLAAAHRQTGRQPSKAIGSFTYVLERWPNTPGARDGLNEARLRQTLLHLKNSQPDAALDNCHKILRDDPSHAKACHLATDILRERGDKNGAVALFNQLMAHSPISHDRLRFADLLVEIGDYTAARAQISFVTEKVEDYSNVANILLGQCELADGAAEEAERLFRRSHTLQRLAPAIFHFFIGEALFAQNRKGEANSHYRKIEDQKDRKKYMLLPEVRGKRTWKLLFLGHPLDTATAQLRIANALFAAGRIDAAENHYLLAVDADPTVAEVHEGLGRCQLYRGGRQEAHISFKQAIALRTGHLEASVELQRLGDELDDSSAPNLPSTSVSAPGSDSVFDELGLTNDAGFSWDHAFAYSTTVG